MATSSPVPVAYRCTKCGHGFVRPTGKLQGSTSCPKCLTRFKREEGRVVADDATNVRREVLERRRQRNAHLYSSVHGQGNADLIRGEQVPLSPSEAKFKARAVEKGWLPHRPSWPDFLVETPDGLIAVEVKSRTDDVRPEQRDTFNLLERAGVPVFLWKDAGPTRATLLRWNSGRATAKAREAFESKKQDGSLSDPEQSPDLPSA